MSPTHETQKSVKSHNPSKSVVQTTYPTYKDSKSPWLGKIPEHWEERKLKFLGSLYAGLNGKKGDDFEKEYKSGFKPFIPFTNIFNNIKINETKFQYVNIGKYETQNRVQQHDVLFLMSSETLEDVGKCSLYIGNSKELYLNSFCKGFRILSKDCSPFYLNYLLQSTSYRNYFSTVGRGFTRINIKQEYVNDLPSLLPPPQEQKTIAEFLDLKTQQIDRAIALKKQQIALLQEQKQIRIQQAVTRGLDASVPLKDSGVDWIGEIPAHWEISKLGNYIDILSGYPFPSSGFTVKGIKLLRGINVDVNQLRWSETVYWDEKKTDNLEQYKLEAGDIVIGMDRPLIGKGLRVARVQQTDLPCLLLQRVCRIRAIKGLTQEYLTAILKSKYFIEYFMPILSGISVPHISPFQIREFKLFLPTIQEQKRILTNLGRMEKKLNELISTNESQIQKLKEYKSTLIDSVVTGKVRVAGDGA